MVGIPTFLHCNFFNKKGEENLKTFQYKGTVFSPYYDYILSPLCAWLVDNVVPRTMAPNLMTLTSFLCSVTAHLILYFNDS